MVLVIFFRRPGKTSCNVNVTAAAAAAGTRVFLLGRPEDDGGRRGEYASGAARLPTLVLFYYHPPPHPSRCRALAVKRKRADESENGQLFCYTAAAVLPGPPRKRITHDVIRKIAASRFSHRLVRAVAEAYSRYCHTRSTFFPVPVNYFFRSP